MKLPQRRISRVSYRVLWLELVHLVGTGITSTSSLFFSKPYLPEAQKNELFRNVRSVMLFTIPRLMTASPSSPAVFDSKVHPVRATRTPECRRAPPWTAGNANIGGKQGYKGALAYRFPSRDLLRSA